jgi:hypothetical protein
MIALSLVLAILLNALLSDAAPYIAEKRGTHQPLEVMIGVLTSDSN